MVIRPPRRALRTIETIEHREPTDRGVAALYYLADIPLTAGNSAVAIAVSDLRGYRNAVRAILCR
jgi:hypothetical protein